MSIAGHEYTVAAVGQSFIENPNCEGCSVILNATRAFNYVYDSDHLDRGPAYLKKIQYLHQQAHEGQLEKLGNLDCINAYAQMIQSNRGSLFLVVRDEDVPAPDNYTWMGQESPVFWRTDIPSSQENPNNMLANYADPYKWICSWQSKGYFANYHVNCIDDVKEIKNSPSEWDTYSGAPIQYCLNVKIEADCQIRWNTQIAIVMVVLNFLKAGLILFTVFGIKEDPLMAIGDAIASFLQKPDSTTANMCIASKNDIIAMKHNFKAGSREWTGKRYCWRHSASRFRRILLFLL